MIEGNPRWPSRAVSLLGASDNLVSVSSPPVDPNAEARLDYQQFDKVGTKEAWDAF
jgi:hypothetical protein